MPVQRKSATVFLPDDIRKPGRKESVEKTCELEDLWILHNKLYEVQSRHGSKVLGRRQNEGQAFIVFCMEMIIKMIVSVKAAKLPYTRGERRVLAKVEERY